MGVKDLCKYNFPNQHQRNSTKFHDLISDVFLTDLE